MRKLIVLPVLMILGVLFIHSIDKEDVSISMQAPDEVTAGTEFYISITLNKGNLQSFSRFQQELPYGLKASSISNANADFTFKDNKVRLIWLTLPADGMITLTYAVYVEERLKGDFEVGGSFSYIENNERKSVSVPVQTIVINPSPNVDPSLQVDIDEYQFYNNKRPAGDDSRIVCIREKAKLNDSGNEIYIKLFVNKENKEKFAKIEENIPAGYTAVVDKRGGGIFTQKGNVVKFLWMNLPEEKNFVVSYKLIPQNGQPVNKLKLNGTFSYMEGQNTITMDIVERDIDVENISEAQLNEILLSLRNTPQYAEVVEPQKDVKDNGTKNVEPYKEPENQVTENQVTETTEVLPEKTNKTNKWNKSYLLEPEEGIYYRVQIAAGHKSINIKRYFRKYKIKEDIKKEEHDGWYKYSVGSFQVYKDARDYRVRIWNTTSIDDAFVAAYNNGKRITVQEALMVANQKWYE
ncbi:MAG: SPOR domain-containing protein [Bacteroidales bacterium]|nr:SPOR domain-containing protein [Bacteroidales bacterium]